MAKTSDIDFEAIRQGLQQLPRAPHHGKGTNIQRENVLIVPNHRAAIDPDRALVVGNRGVGKSFWTAVLSDSDARAFVAKTFKELATVDAVVGFNASDRVETIAPTKNALDEALKSRGNPDALWRAVLLRAAMDQGVAVPKDVDKQSFSRQVEWVIDHGEDVDRIITALDDAYVAKRRKLVLVFDELDRLGTDWQTKRTLTAALLERALAARSFRAIRLKLFMRRDQFEDPRLFQFADGSKLKNQRVDLEWSTSDLYDLLFKWLAEKDASQKAFATLFATMQKRTTRTSADVQENVVKAIAGEFMGAGAKQGRVYTWLPLHLADARNETSPRTFLTAWREAALRDPAPTKRAVDHLGIHEGVRKASADRLEELYEDYAWIKLALNPLRGQQVPMERSALKNLWRTKKTASEILQSSTAAKKLPPVQLDSAHTGGGDQEGALLEDLVAIGIVEVRPNEKVNVPDIFRLEAGIKRKGGVPAPPSR